MRITMTCQCCREVVAAILNSTEMTTPCPSCGAEYVVSVRKESTPLRRIAALPKGQDQRSNSQPANTSSVGS